MVVVYEYEWRAGDGPAGVFETERWRYGVSTACDGNQACLTEDE